MLRDIPTTILHAGGYDYGFVYSIRLVTWGLQLMVTSGPVYSMRDIGLFTS